MNKSKTGYLTLDLFKAKLFNLYFKLIIFPENSYSKVTSEEVRGHNHYKINIFLKRAKEGGEFFCWFENNPINKRIFKFRPDSKPHGVLKVRKGSLWILSIGWIRRSKSG